MDGSRGEELQYTLLCVRVGELPSEYVPPSARPRLCRACGLGVWASGRVLPDIDTRVAMPVCMECAAAELVHLPESEWPQLHPALIEEASELGISREAQVKLVRRLTQTLQRSTASALWVPGKPL